MFIESRGVICTQSSVCLLVVTFSPSRRVSCTATTDTYCILGMCVLNSLGLLPLHITWSCLPCVSESDGYHSEAKLSLSTFSLLPFPCRAIQAPLVPRQAMQGLGLPLHPHQPQDGSRWCGRRASTSAWPSSSCTLLLPSELTLWVDPFEVSYRIGEDGSICVLYESHARGDHAHGRRWASVTASSPSGNNASVRPNRWTVTSAARRNWWCWAEPVPPKPTVWWLCPVKEAHCHPGLLIFRVTPCLVRSLDQIRVSLFKAKNMKWNSERREKKKRKKKAEDVAYRPGDGNLVGFDIFYPVSPIVIFSVVSLDQLGHSVFSGEALWKWNCWGS